MFAKELYEAKLLPKEWFEKLERKVRKGGVVGQVRNYVIVLKRQEAFLSQLAKTLEIHRIK